MSGRLTTVPQTLTAAMAYVREHHRHHRTPQGGLFAVGCADESGKLVGVAIVGRPVARGLQDGRTAEVTRVATDGTANACSILYAACWRAARAIGYQRLVTYTLASEGGASLRATGFRLVGRVTGRQWSCPSRPRSKNAVIDKQRWELPARAEAGKEE